MKWLWFVLALATIARVPCLGATPQDAPQITEKLDDLAAEYLFLPQVLTEIHITGAQTQRLLARQLTALMRAAMDFEAGRQKVENEGGTGNVNLSWNFTESSDRLPALHLRDLAEAQKIRLRQIAIQDCPLAALQTDDVAFALQLTPEQRQRLRATYDEAGAAMAKIARQRFAFVQKAIDDAAAKTGAADEDVTKAALAAIPKCEDAFVATGCLTIPTVRGSRTENEHALGVLTNEQRRRLRKLEGKPFKLDIW
jgi:hypothetical protein